MHLKIVLLFDLEQNNESKLQRKQEHFGTSVLSSDLVSVPFGVVDLDRVI